MIRHAWTVLCSRSSIDSETNNLSLFDVIEQLNISEPVAGQVHAAFPHEVVSLWTRDNLEEGGEGEARHKVVAPSSWTTTGDPVRIDLTRFKRLRIRARPEAFPIEGPGLYWVIVEFRPTPDAGWQEVSRVPLEVRVGPVPPNA